MKNRSKSSLRMSVAAVVLLMGLGATVYAAPVLVSGISSEASEQNTYHQSMQGFGEKDISATPVPPAVWLFGSGLIGLMVIARRGNGSQFRNYR